jgi:hypothetical protein
MEIGQETIMIDGPVVMMTPTPDTDSEMMTISALLDMMTTTVKLKGLHTKTNFDWSENAMLGNTNDHTVKKKSRGVAAASAPQRRAMEILKTTARALVIAQEVLRTIVVTDPNRQLDVATTTARKHRLVDDTVRVRVVQKILIAMSLVHHPGIKRPTDLGKIEQGMTIETVTIAHQENPTAEIPATGTIMIETHGIEVKEMNGIVTRRLIAICPAEVELTQTIEIVNEIGTMVETVKETVTAIEIVTGIVTGIGIGTVIENGESVIPVAQGVGAEAHDGTIEASCFLSAIFITLLYSIILGQAKARRHRLTLFDVHFVTT